MKRHGRKTLHSEHGRYHATANETQNTLTYLLAAIAVIRSSSAALA